MTAVRKVFSKQYCFIRCKKLYLWATGYRKHSRFTFVESTISNSPKVQRAKFLGRDKLFCFISICTFGSFKNPSAMITSLSELYFTFRNLLCWCKWKWFQWTLAAAQAAENHRDEWELTLNLWWGIYTSIPTTTESQNFLAVAEALSLKIYFHGTSLKWSQRPPQLAH